MKLDHKHRDHHRHHSSTADHERHQEQEVHHVPHAAEAGVETDTRWGDAEESFDITGSVMRVESARGGSRITISRGRADGIHVGMEGYLRNGKGLEGESMLADFSVESVDKRSCTAIVDVRPDDLQHVTAVVNPSQPIVRTQPASDHRAHIVRVTVSMDGRARIVISGGRDEGLTYGMAGYVVGANGHPIAHFELEQVDSRSCAASVDLTPDVLQRNPNVVLQARR